MTMISPELYVKYNLEGQPFEIAVKKTKELQSDIRKMKKTAENKLDSREEKYRPSLQTRIISNWWYLEASRKYFEEQGWEYPLSKEEERDLRFNSRLGEIVKIEFDYGAVRAFSRFSETIRLEGDTLSVARIPFFTSSEEERKEQMQSDLEGCPKEEFLEMLAIVHIGAWKRNYQFSNPDYVILDGYDFRLLILYQNGDRSVYQGTNCFPYNFSVLLDVLDIPQIHDRDDEEDEESEE